MRKGKWEREWRRGEGGREQVSVCVSIKCVHMFVVTMADVISD